MEDCIFCKIVNKEIPSEIVYEDERILAFRDINPAAKIHILVITKKHIAKLTEMEEEDSVLIGEVYKAINEIAKKEGIFDKGFRVIVNCGKDSGQEVDHLHFHLLGGEYLGPKIVH